MTPTLYCLMREDLQDLNPGKGMAQAMHAQADFDEWVTKNKNSGHIPFIKEWKEDRSFGRTLVLEASFDQISNIIAIAMCTAEPADVTVDPTYPWRNYYGKLFVTSEVTCAWVFACDITPQNVLDELRKLSLHK